MDTSAPTTFVINGVVAPEHRDAAQRGRRNYCLAAAGLRGARLHTEEPPPRSLSRIIGEAGIVRNARMCSAGAPSIGPAFRQALRPELRECLRRRAGRDAGKPHGLGQPTQPLALTVAALVSRSSDPDALRWLSRPTPAPPCFATRPRAQRRASCGSTGCHCRARGDRAFPGRPHSARP